MASKTAEACKSQSGHNNAWAEVMANILQSTNDKKVDEKSTATNKSKKHLTEAKISGGRNSNKSTGLAKKLSPSKKISKPALGKSKTFKLLIASALGTNDLKSDAARIEKERQLRRTATRGVVQLFNMLKKEQTPLDTPSAPTPAVKARKQPQSSADSGVAPRSFLELLAESSRLQRAHPEEPENN